MGNKKVSVVLPVCNEKDNLRILHERLKESFAKSGVGYEVIFVDDGSTDGSLEVIKELRAHDRGIKFISLSRNFGHQNAIFAGLTQCTGDAAIVMDADLQHPPSLICRMIEMWQYGTDIVYTTKRLANIPLVKNIVVRLSYWFISRISGLKLKFGQSDFRLIDKKVLKVILDMPEYHKFLRGQIEWLGFKQEGFAYDVEPRYSGKAKYSYKSLYELALNGIFSFGKYPLHIIMIFALLVFAVSSAYILLILATWILRALNIVDLNMPLGWTSMVVVVLFLGSVQLMVTAVIGEYIGRVFDQTKGRPVFIVKEKSENV